jgi:hypothetical protein
VVAHKVVDDPADERQCAVRFFYCEDFFHVPTVDECVSLVKC